MSNKTFCVLLAGFLMLMSGATVWFMRERAEVGPIRDAALTVGTEKIMLPLKGAETVQQYGAQYCAEFGQWTMSDEVELKPGTDQCVYAPLSGRIAGVERTDAGVIVIIESDEKKIEVYPVHGVRVFEGSLIACGEILGEAGGYLRIRAEMDGVSVDPLELQGEISFMQGEMTGAER